MNGEARENSLGYTLYKLLYYCIMSTKQDKIKNENMKKIFIISILISSFNLAFAQEKAEGIILEIETIQFPYEIGGLTILKAEGGASYTFYNGSSKLYDVTIYDCSSVVQRFDLDLPPMIHNLNGDPIPYSPRLENGSSLVLYTSNCESSFLVAVTENNQFLGNLHLVPKNSVWE
jgi:hypothetical protein